MSVPDDDVQVSGSLDPSSIVFSNASVSAFVLPFQSVPNQVSGVFLDLPAVLVCGVTLLPIYPSVSVADTKLVLMLRNIGHNAVQRVRVIPIDRRWSDLQILSCKFF